MLQIVNTINSYLSDYILVFLLVAVGLWYTVKTKCVQRYLWKGLKQLFGGFSLRGGSQGGGMSSFQAVATAIAAQVGTGNIVGSAGAILVGGPGAIFWMWIIAFLGMATIYAEATLAQKTRVTDAEGNIQGGPVYYIQTAFKGKFGTFLAGFFFNRNYTCSWILRMHGTVQLNWLHNSDGVRNSVLDCRYLPCYYLWIYLHGRCRSSCFRY